MLEQKIKFFNIIFVVCLILIFILSIYIYLTSTNFYYGLDETIQNNINMNFEVMRNEKIEYVEELLNNRLSDL